MVVLLDDHMVVNGTRQILSYRSFLLNGVQNNFRIWHYSCDMILFELHYSMKFP